MRIWVPLLRHQTSKIHIRLRPNFMHFPALHYDIIPTATVLWSCRSDPLLVHCPAAAAPREQHMLRIFSLGKHTRTTTGQAEADELKPRRWLKSSKWGTQNNFAYKLWDVCSFPDPLLHKNIRAIFNWNSDNGMYNYIAFGRKMIFDEEEEERRTSHSLFVFCSQ